MVYTFVMWLHLLAAMVWIGGMVFVLLVLEPGRRGDPGRVGLLEFAEIRFRTIRWVSIVTLAVTGFFNLLHEGGSSRLESSWGGVLMLKLFLFLVAVGLTVVHDFILSPTRRSAAPHWLNQAILGVGLLIVLVGVVLARFA